jgi:4-hydroxy-tetrahydrodipicolinate reductase
MTKIVISGAAGRMGRAIVALARDNADFQIVGAIEANGHPDLGQDAGVIAGVAALGVPLRSDLAEIISSADVVVDFSEKASAVLSVEIARQAGKGMVIGITGFTENETAHFEAASTDIPILLSPNMSVGVNLLFGLVAETARKLKGYDIEILEIHHNKKKDAPSGTAKKLARIAAEATGRDLARYGVYGREGIVGERKPEEIGILAARAGDVVGEHTVIFAGPGERVELTHRAHSRNTFASGALRAAQFIAKAPPGFYSMADVLEV